MYAVIVYTIFINTYVELFDIRTIKDESFNDLFI